MRKVAKKVFVLFILLVLLFVGNFANGNKKINIIAIEESEEMKTEKEFNGFINDLSKFPVNFIYDDVYYSGFRPKYFSLIDKSVKESQDKDTVNVVISLRKSSSLKVIIEANLYRSYNAYDYKVSFENDGTTDSGIITQLNDFDFSVQGNNPVLKGILGDHGNSYSPYNYDLTQNAVNFTSTLGRSCHFYFPYFNLETDNGGYLIALGWSGTWQADFKYNESANSTKVTLKNSIGYEGEGIKTYLKPGEILRTSLIGIVRYYERNEDKAMNSWRKWMVDCNLPRENASTDEPANCSMAVFLAWDSDRPNSDGSISEYDGSWKRSLDAIYSHGLYPEFRWFDAGWYYDPYGKTVPSDWWGTVGTWELDKDKWPNNSFRQSVDYAHERGTKTLVWFEAERVTHLDGLTANYGYNRKWVLSDWGNNNVYLNNLGDKDCLQWTLNRVLLFMKENNIDLYREDFNLDPAIFWAVGDGPKTNNRQGITENLYIQGHYALWDGIISYCAQNGKCTYVDSCASGGGRNDLETVRRSVPLLRSDSDRTSISLKLAFTTTLSRWLPYTGAVATDSSNQLAAGNVDAYAMRAAFIPHVTLSARFYHEQDTVPWNDIIKSRNEWLEAKQYFFKDFYVLTPYRGINNERDWTCYMYFDEAKDSGLLQAFRQSECTQSSYTVKLKGVNPNNYYRVRDIDNQLSVDRIKGSDLINGITLSASQPRTALVLYIESI